MAWGLATFNPLFAGEAVDFPNLGVYPLPVSDGVLRCIRIAADSDYANVDRGTELWIKWPVGDSEVFIPTISQALRRYPVRVWVGQAGGRAHHRGLYLMTEVDRAGERWCWQRIDDDEQRRFPTVEQWLAGAVDNPSVERPRRLTVAEMRARAADRPAARARPSARPKKKERAKCRTPTLTGGSRASPGPGGPSCTGWPR